MNTEFSISDEEKIICVLNKYKSLMLKDILDTIEKTEISINADLKSQNVSWKKHSPGNKDFLTAVAHEHLLELLHKGNVDLAKHILIINSLSVDVIITKDDYDNLVLNENID